MRMRDAAAGLMALAAVSAAGGANAAPLGLDTTTPVLSTGNTLVDYVEFLGNGDLSSFFSPVIQFDGIPQNGLTELSFVAGFSLADPTTGLTGGFDVFDAGGLFIQGNLAALGFDENLIELQFDTLSGPGTAAFGDSVLLSIAFADDLGANPFDALGDGQAYEATLTLANVAEIPAPGALALLLSGLVGLAALRLRERRLPTV